MYGKSWSCPPAVGTVDACRARCLAYPEALLVVTDLPILDISLASGFNSERTFTRLFKDRNGITPSTFRNQHIRETT